MSFFSQRQEISRAMDHASEELKFTHMYAERVFRAEIVGHKVVFKYYPRSYQDDCDVFFQYGQEITAGEKMTEMFLDGLSPHILPFYWSGFREKVTELFPDSELDHESYDELILRKFPELPRDNRERMILVQQLSKLSIDRSYSLHSGTTPFSFDTSPQNVYHGDGYWILMPDIKKTLGGYFLDAIKEEMDPSLGAKNLRQVFFQVLYTLATIQTKYPHFSHGDLHLDNLSVRETRGDGYHQYDLLGQRWYQPENGIVVDIFDYGRTVMDLSEWASSRDAIRNHPDYHPSFYQNRNDDFGRLLASVHLDMLWRMDEKVTPGAKKLLQAMIDVCLEFYTDTELVEKIIQTNENILRGPYYGYSPKLSSLFLRPDQYLIGNYFREFQKKPTGEMKQQVPMPGGLRD